MFEDLDEIRTFLRVIDQGSLSAAARSLHLSVNAVWARMRRIEERAGLPLIERTSRSLRVTELGLRLAERMRRILVELDGAEGDVSAATQRLRGKVRIAIPSGPARQALPSLLALLREHPELNLEILGQMGPDMLGRLDIDFIVWGGPIPESSLTIKRIDTLRWAIAAAPSYALRRGIPRTPEELAAHDCLLACKQPAETSWPLVDAQGRLLEVPIFGRLACGEEETMAAALHAGHGIGIRPLGEVIDGARAGTLVHVLPGYCLRPMEVFIVAPQGRLRQPRVRAVAEVVTRDLRRLFGSELA